MAGMESWKEGPAIAGGPTRAGQVDAAAAFGSKTASWYLVVYRVLVMSMLGTVFLRAAANLALSRARQRQLDEAVAAAGAPVRQQGVPRAATAAAGLPGPKTAEERDHVAHMLAGVQRLQAEMMVMDAEGSTAEGRSTVPGAQLALTDGP